MTRKSADATGSCCNHARYNRRRPFRRQSATCLALLGASKCSWRPPIMCRRGTVHQNRHQRHAGEARGQVRRGQSSGRSFSSELNGGNAPKSVSRRRPRGSRKRSPVGASIPKVGSDEIDCATDVAVSGIGIETCLARRRSPRRSGVRPSSSSPQSPPRPRNRPTSRRRKSCSGLVSAPRVPETSAICPSSCA